MSETALNHVHHLSVTIGPRGSTTDQERAGHQYVQETLESLGYAPTEEQFISALSAYQPFFLGLGATLIGWGLFYTQGPAGALAAAVLGLGTTVSIALELFARDNPLRWLSPVGVSQNVFAVAPAGGEPKRRAVIAAHVDSHRTPLIWASRGFFRAYRVITTLGTISLALLVVLFLWGLFAPESDLPRVISVYPAGVLGFAFALVVQGHYTRFSPGANDNASGVGVLLALAERLKAEPLPITEVILLATGCEEVGAYGMADFLRRHRDEFKDAEYLVVDNVGGNRTGPCYLRSEGLAFPVKPDGELLALADRLAQEIPTLGAYSVHQQGAYTDAIHVLNAGLPALAVVGYTRHGWIPDWHNKSDTFERVDPAALDRTEAFVWELLQRLDAGA